MAKILVVDDDVASLNLVGKFLANRGHECILTSSPHEALALAFKETPDLVLLDVMMPDIDGWTIAQRLRQRSDVPIIFVTVRSSVQDKIKGFELKADDYITKPFDLRELLMRVDSVLRRFHAAHPPGPTSLEYPPFFFDTLKKEVSFKGKPLNLTPKEYFVLFLLAEKKGATLSPEEIVHKVWGKDYTPQSADLKKYIWMIRQKIEADPANPRYLLTVRGFGYRLQSESP
ncbi:MAG: response regulator transcription factor [bacterium JZ-2024 1]